LALGSGLFFSARAAAADLALAVRRYGLQVRVQFMPSPPDGFFIQARDLRKLDIRRTGRFLGEHGDVPSALGFIEPTQQQIDLLMIAHNLAITLRLADRTLALMDKKR
jgi:hypothetical protein